MTSLRSAVLTSFVLLALPSWCAAQGSGNTSGGSNTSSTSSTSAASQAGSTFGGSSTGASAAGGSQGAAGGGLQQPAFTQFGQAGADVGTGFVGRGNSEQAFVGAAGAGQQTVDAGGTARFSGLGGGQGGAGGAAADTSQARGGQMRIPQRIAFSFPAVAPTAISFSLQSQFTKLQARLPGIVVAATEPGHVVLRGSVESEQSRQLAAAIARLEPGVRRVTNELLVAAPNAPVVAPRLGR